MSTRIGINGFGRIGRNFVRAALARNSDLSVVAVNDLTSADLLAHLLKYDSVLGRLGREVTVTAGGIAVDGQEIAVTSEKDLSVLDWGRYGVDIVLEATGKFNTGAEAGKHLANGARKVLVSAPTKGEDVTLVLGVNDEAYDPDAHHVISMASCTTGCVAPMARILLESFGIEQGYMTTVHAYTNDQRTLDFVHKDPRRARAAAVNIIPTSTGAARSVGLVIPALKGRLDGLSLRVPVPDGSVTDLVCILERETTRDEVNEAFRAAAGTAGLRGILTYTEDPIVSSDIVGDPHSCTIDGAATMAHGRVAKVLGWYDNEWGYSNRLVELAEIIAAKL
ncbi:MAG TPA: type I glyceraldehyde-3-phosphate dehydrogenase [Actinomycetota bacterium]|nr:type I glyceraldehyde-3-phosphate dehydrogenase [Actinomycetota bacterium]